MKTGQRRLSSSEYSEVLKKGQVIGLMPKQACVSAAAMWAHVLSLLPVEALFALLPRCAAAGLTCCQGGLPQLSAAMLFLLLLTASMSFAFDIC